MAYKTLSCRWRWVTSPLALAGWWRAYLG